MKNIRSSNKVVPKVKLTQSNFLLTSDKNPKSSKFNKNANQINVQTETSEDFNLATANSENNQTTSSSPEMKLVKGHGKILKNLTKNSITLKRTPIVKNSCNNSTNKSERELKETLQDISGSLGKDSNQLTRNVNKLNSPKPLKTICFGAKKGAGPNSVASSVFVKKVQGSLKSRSNGNLPSVEKEKNFTSQFLNVFEKMKYLCGNFVQPFDESQSIVASGSPETLVDELKHLLQITKDNFTEVDSKRSQEDTSTATGTLSESTKFNIDLIRVSSKRRHEDYQNSLKLCKDTLQEMVHITKESDTNSGRSCNNFNIVNNNTTNNSTNNVNLNVNFNMRQVSPDLEAVKKKKMTKFHTKKKISKKLFNRITREKLYEELESEDSLEDCVNENVQANVPKSKKYFLNKPQGLCIKMFTEGDAPELTSEEGSDDEVFLNMLIKKKKKKEDNLFCQQEPRRSKSLLDIKKKRQGAGKSRFRNKSPCGLLGDDSVLKVKFNLFVRLIRKTAANSPTNFKMFRRTTRITR